MYNPIELQRIDRQIEDLQRLKANMQNLNVGIPQQPINNIITTPQQMVQPQPIFEAKFTTENPSDILVTNKTAFINLKDGKLSIKEVDGEIKEYYLILPKDEKDLKIENLENKLREMETKLNQVNQINQINQNKVREENYNEYSKYNEPVDEKSEPNCNDNEYASKSKSKNNFFKSNGK